jgi:hypothetical protein
MEEGNIMATSGSEITSNSETVEDVRLCPECGVGELVQFEIWEDCTNPSCSYGERVECCHECAGIIPEPFED